MNEKRNLAAKLKLIIMRLFVLLAVFICACSNGQEGVLGVATYRVSLTNANIVADGNSYTQGNGYTPYSTLIMQSAPFSTNGATMQNFGVGGQTTAQMLSDQSSQVLSLYTSGKANIILFQEGGNDLYFNGRVDSALARVKRYCDNARAAGFKVIVSTLIHREQTTMFGDTPTQYNTKIDQFNTALLADSSFYDGAIQPHLEAIFSTYSSGGYDADQVHPNDTGQAKYAELYRAALLALE
jgi:lysophospholipase L1-like esterase